MSRKNYSLGVAWLVFAVLLPVWLCVQGWRWLEIEKPFQIRNFVAQSEGAAAPDVAHEVGQGGDAPDFGEVARVLAEFTPQTHLLRQALDDGKGAQAWTNYLASLDYERIYFLQEDIDEFEKHRLTLADKFKKGDLGFADQVYHRYRERVKERTDYVEETLRTPFDFTKDEVYKWKRKDAPWPANLEEQDKIWRLRIKNEMLARILNQEERVERAKQEAPEEKEENTGLEALGEAREAEAEAGAEAEGETKADASPASPATPVVTNEEFILKRYRQYLSMLDDSDEEFRLSRFFNAVTMAFDPHTSYLSPVSVEDFSINMQLSLQGIGAQLRSDEGTARIEEIIAGGPADRDTRDIRLVKGDRIIGVGQGDEPIVDTLHWPLYKTVRLIRGAKGSKVVLLVQPVSDPSGMTTKTVDLIRDEVRLEEQAATSRLETIKDAQGKERLLGTVRLPTFYSSMSIGPESAEPRSAAADIARLIADMNTQNIEGLILDLRGNGGGALKEAIDVAGLFIRTGPVVLVKERSRVHTLMDTDPSIAFRKPLIVLVDRISASASEIVAGALQDYGRAIIIGDSQTHGKGTVQQVLNLDARGRLGSLKVTNANFYRINGSSTQVKGVSSDILLPSAFDYFTELGEDKLPNAIPWSTVSSARYRTVDTLRETIAGLKAKSDKRLTDDERWQQHLKRLKRFETIGNLVELPLQIEQRRAMIAEERTLSELTDEDEGEGEGGTSESREEARRARDVVMDEALRILVDLIDDHGTSVSLEQEAADGRLDSIFERFFR